MSHQTVKFSSSVTSIPTSTHTPRVLRHHSSSSSFGNVSAIEEMSPPNLNETPIVRRRPSNSQPPPQLSSFIPGAGTFMTEFDMPPPILNAPSQNNLLSQNNTGVDIHQLSY